MYIKTRPLHYIVARIYIINIRDDSDFNGFTRWTFANMNNEYNVIYLLNLQDCFCAPGCQNGNSAIETNPN